MSITVGMKGRAETVVNHANTAQAACSGALPVFGTPFMCALMEEAAEIDGKRLVLKVTAFDEKGPIGQGIHERFIVTDERFLAKTGKKLEGLGG